MPVPALRRPHARSAGVHRTGQAARLLARRDHGPDGDLGQRALRPVQRRFHELITQKLRTANRQVVELTVFAAQLEVAAEQLSGEAVDGPCGDDCACLTATPVAVPTSSPVRFRSEPVDVPIACTLEPGARRPAGRVENRPDHVRSRVTTADGGLRIEFDAAADIGRLASLVAAEQRCCAFFSFADGRPPRSGAGGALHRTPPASSANCSARRLNHRAIVKAQRWSWLAWRAGLARSGRG